MIDSCYDDIDDDDYIIMFIISMIMIMVMMIHDDDLNHKCVCLKIISFSSFFRENHSEIERRRRNKMNAYINELSDMVPTCNGLPKKPDKLTILKMAVTYIKSLRGYYPFFHKSSL